MSAYAYEIDAQAFAMPPMDRPDAFDVVADALEENGLQAAATARRSWAQTMRECFVVCWSAIPAALREWREFEECALLPRRMRLRLVLNRGDVQTYDLDDRGGCEVDLTGTVECAAVVDRSGYSAPLTLDSPYVVVGQLLTVTGFRIEMGERAWRPTIAQAREIGFDMSNSAKYVAALDAIGAEGARS